MGNSTATASATRNLYLDRDIPGFTLVSLTATEGVSQINKYELICTVNSGGNRCRISDLPGQTVGAWFTDAAGNSPRRIEGIVARIADVETDDPAHPSIVMEVRPWIWLLTHNVQCRIYQSATVIDIIEDLIKDLSTKTSQSYNYDLSGLGSSYTRRNYCVQYNESDFEFLSRLLEDEGIYYYYNQNLILTFADKSTAAAKTQQLIFNPSNRDISSIVAWKRDQNYVPFRYSGRDFNFEAPARTFLGASSNLPQCGDMPDKLSPLHHAEAPAEFGKFVDEIGATATGKWFEPPDPTSHLQPLADSRAAIRNQELVSRSSRLQGRSRTTSIYPGYAFDLFSSTSQWDNLGTFFNVSITHEVKTSSTQTQTGSDNWTYRNSIECLPYALAYRPQRKTPKPRINGAQTARVVGPESFEVNTDIFGRVLVEFPWSISESSQTEFDDSFAFKRCSAWVRVAHPSAGNNWGTQTVPRVGQEVVVGFENGDPDMPIVLGCVHNSKNPPTFPLLEFKFSSGMKTHSSHGDVSDFNGIRFDDTQGKELAQLRSNRDMLIDAKDTIVVGAASRFHRYVGASDVHVVGGGILPGIKGDYQPKAEFAQHSFPPHWDPLTIREGGMFSTNTVQANFGNETALNSVFKLNATSSRHDVAGVCVSPMMLMLAGVAAFASFNATFKGGIRALAQGLGRLDFNVGPYAEITAGSSLALRRGGHFEFAQDGSWSKLPAVGILLKLGWFLYAISSGIVPSVVVGVSPNSADKVSKICAFISRALGFILLNVEHRAASVSAGMEIAKFAALLARSSSVSGHPLVSLLNFKHSLKKALSAIAAMAKDLDSGNQFIFASNGLYLNASDIGLRGDSVAITAEKTGVVVQGKSVTMRTRADNGNLVLGITDTSLKHGSAMALTFDDLLGLKLKNGPGSITIDATGNITIEGASVRLKTAGGATLQLIGPRLSSSSPIQQITANLSQQNNSPSMSVSAS